MPSPRDRQISAPGGPPRRQVITQSPFAGGEHHAACPRSAGALVASQAREWIAGLRRQRRRQDRAVLDRLAGALSQIGEHWMRSVAQDGGPAACPLRNWIAVVKRPLVPDVRSGKQAQQGLVPVGVTLEHLLAAALSDP